jgi:Ser/Thr protein kinase RdoA (MazF antagonist)
MAADDRIERILGLYPEDCQPRALTPFTAATSFSGARLWRVIAPRGPLCLRRWPAEHPSVERLEFIQAVLWHVDQEGFRHAPLPLETRHHHGYVWHAGHLWELTPWLSGAADYAEKPSPQRLENALRALAEFHLAAATFPLPDVGPAASPGIQERRDRLRELRAGRLADLQGAITPGDWPELAARARELLARFNQSAAKVEPLLAAAAAAQVNLQPCIRDVWSAHVLFEGNEVSGLVDFGSLRPENPAADVARLLGSLAGDNPADWQRGLAAYQTIRRLSPEELTLVSAFDRSTVLMGGLQWLDWIYLVQREFTNRAAVLARVDDFLARLAKLGESHK